MNFTKYLHHFYFILLLLGLLPNNSEAQTYETATEIKELKNTILEHDRQFWEAYNTCDIENFGTFITDDLEFYHDKGGMTKTADSLIVIMKRGLCDSGQNQIFREAVEGTVEVFPMNNIGAIISGSHTFQEKVNGKLLPPSGIAKFTHIWTIQNGEWKMSRVLSYDHQPFEATP